MLSSLHLKAAVLATLLTVTNAWSFGGHLTIARMAEKLLGEDSQTVSDVKSILSILEKSNPSLTKKEVDHPFVECAIFADEIKYEGGGYQSGWHFMDQPYLDEGGKPSDFGYKIPTNNVTDAIRSIVSWFKEEGDYTNNQYYKAIHGSWPRDHTDEDSYSVAIRLLIHYVGDSHQPLHSETRLDKEYPSGDRGGNDLHLPSHYSLKNLHAVWDRVVYKLKKNPHLPFEADGFADFDDYVDSLMQNYPVDSLDGDVTNLDPAQWEKESFKIASTFSYIGVHDGEKLSDDYVQKGQVMAEQQLVKAGHRLANLLKTLKFHTPSAQALFLQN